MNWKKHEACDATRSKTSEDHPAFRTFDVWSFSPRPSPQAEDTRRVLLQYMPSEAIPKAPNQIEAAGYVCLD